MEMLKEPVMVVNKLWQAIRVIPAKRAFKLLFAGRACVISDDENYSVYSWDEWALEDALDSEKGIQTANRRIKIPKVIVLMKYDKVHRKGLRLTKSNIYRRDGSICQYTGKKVSQKDSDIDHIIPRSRGGRNSWDNMVVCTKSINREKGDKTPKEAGLKLIKPPKKPSGNQLLIDPKIKVPEFWKKFME